MPPASAVVVVAHVDDVPVDLGGHLQRDGGRVVRVGYLAVQAPVELLDGLEGVLARVEGTVADGAGAGGGVVKEVGPEGGEVDEPVAPCSGSGSKPPEGSSILLTHHQRHQ